jgi:hypothetical protein
MTAIADPVAVPGLLCVSGYRVIVNTMDCPSGDQRGSFRAVFVGAENTTRRSPLATSWTSMTAASRPLAPSWNRTNAIFEPSGDHAGSATSPQLIAQSELPVTIAAALVPSASTTQISKPRSVAASKAIRAPSGDQSGWKALYGASESSVCASVPSGRTR